MAENCNRSNVRLCKGLNNLVEIGKNGGKERKLDKNK